MVPVGTSHNPPCTSPGNSYQLQNASGCSQIAMPGRESAPRRGAILEREVAELVARLGLEARRKVRVGRRLWGNVRQIDVVAMHPQTRKTLGLECKFQGTRGTTEEKIPSLINDIEAWPIAGIVVFDGPGFSENMKLYLLSTGRAVALEDLEDWLILFFAL